jgi:HAD superfamily hydrolase (TIGR01509 family)
LSLCPNGWKIQPFLIDGDMEVEDLEEVPGTRKIINDLKKNYRVAGFTNMSPEMFAFYTAKWQFDRVFNKVFHSGELGIRKPEKRAFQAILKKLKTKPENVIFIDDREENVEGAKKAGIQGVQFKNPAQLVRALQQLNVRVK